MNITDFSKQCELNEAKNLKLSQAQKLTNYSIGLNFEISQILNSLKEDAQINKEVILSHVGSSYYFITNSIILLKEDPKNLFEESMIINFHQKQSLYLRWIPKSLIGLRETFIRHNLQELLNEAIINTSINLNLIKECRGTVLNEKRFIENTIQILSALNSILKLLETKELEQILDDTVNNITK